MIDSSSSPHRNITHLYKIQCLSHAEPDTMGISFAQVTFVDNALLRIKIDVPERTHLHAHFAAYTAILLHDNGIGLRIALQCPYGTDCETDRLLTMDTRQGRHKSVLWIDMSYNVGLLLFEISGSRKGTRPLAIFASNTAIQINGDDFHIGPGEILGL